MTTSTELRLTHPWQEAGMGVAPYAFAGCVDAGQGSIHSCDACGAGIRYLFFVVDGSGREFKVGCDCIEKVGDNRMTSDAIEAKKAIKYQREREAEEARRKAAIAAREAKLELQREANGGMTDEELRRFERGQEVERINGWLIEAFGLRDADHGSWDGLNDLLMTPITEKTPRYIDIVAKLWGQRFGGRSGSKAWKAATDQFWDQLDAVK